LTYLIYLFPLAISLLFAQKNNKIVNFVLFANLVLLTIIVGFRHFQVGQDTINYVIMYQDKAYSYYNLLYFLEDINKRTEIIPLICESVLSRYTDNYLWFNLTIAVANYLTLFFYLKTSKFSNAYLYFYIVLGFFFISSNAVRQAPALNLFLLAVHYRIYGQNKKAIIAILLGSLFHYSILLASFPLVFLGKVYINNYKLILLYISAFILNVTQFLDLLIPILDFMPGSYASYLTRDNGISESGYGLSLVVNFTYFILLLYARHNYKNKIIINYLLIALLGQIFWVFSGQDLILHRFFNYYYIFLIPSLFFVTKLLMEKKYYFIFYGLHFLLITNYCYKIYISDSGCSPYRSILE